MKINGRQHRGVVSYSYSALKQILHLPDDIHFTELTYEPGRDIYKLHVWGDGVKDLSGYSPISEGVQAPEVQLPPTEKKRF